MANQLSETPKPPETPAQKTYSEADLRAAVAEASARSLAESNAQLQQAAMARNMAPPAPRGPDGFDAFAKEGLTKSPEEQARMLRHGTQTQIRGELTQAVQAIRQESFNELQRAKDEMAMRAVLAGNPEIANDQEGYAAAMAKAAWRADQQGRQVDSAALAQMAVSIYREDHKPALPDVPYVEGASRPAEGPGGTVTPNAKRTDAEVFLEEGYGVGTKWGDTFHPEKRNPSSPEAINEYLDQRFSPIAEGNVVEWGPTKAAENSRIGDVLGPALQRATRRAAAGGK